MGCLDRCRAVTAGGLVSLVAATLGLAAAGCGSPGSPAGGSVRGLNVAPIMARSTAKGTALVNRYFRLLKARDTKGLDQLLSPSFRATRPGGSTQDRASYLAVLPRITSFAISHVVVRSALGALVVSYQVRAQRRVSGVRQPVTGLPRLAVFASRHGTWRLVALANFSATMKQSRPAG